MLFRIDPRSYQAVLDRANAQLAQAEASSVQAEENFNRIDELARRQVATAKQLEDVRAARDQSRAAIMATKADINNAKLNMEHTTIAAPVSGPTSLVSPPEGSLALAQQTVLTTITQLDPAYVNFSISEAEFVELRNINQARDKPLTEDDVEVSIRYGDGTAYPVKGKLNVSSSLVDARTGTLQIRLVFPNADGALLPNQFVRILLSGISLPNVFVVPQQAVSQGPQGAFVYVVNSTNNGVAARPVKLDREVKGAAPLEQQINGVENMLYMQSTSTGSGTLSIFVTFAIGTNHAPSALRGTAPGRRRTKAVDGDPSALDDVVIERALRYDLHWQLRSHQRDRRVAPHARRW